MEHEIAETAGWLIRPVHAWMFLAFWSAVVLVYGIVRSLGAAEQDPIRPSGPTD